MAFRTIPIHPAADASPPIMVPRLRGEPRRVQALVTALQRAVDDELGITLPAGAWLRQLHLADGEIHVGLAPGMRQRGHGVAHAVFDTLRRRLHDTDIYVGTVS